MDLDIPAALNSHVVTHEVIGTLLLLTTAVSWLLLWFLVRREYIVTGSMIPNRRSLGWALAGKLFWEGLLYAALGLLVLFSRNALPWWGIIIVVGLFLSSVVLFWAYARTGVR